MILRIVIILAVLLIAFAVYEIIGLLRKKATVYYVGEDGNARPFGMISFNIASNSYQFRDNTQSPPNRYQGYSNVENGLALINLRDDPSIADLASETHTGGWVDLSGTIYDKRGVKLGYITNARGQRGIYGSGKWYELWLRKHSYVYICPQGADDNGNNTPADVTLIGKIIETGRIGHGKPNTFTVTARAGGFLLLYRAHQPKPQSEDAQVPSASWKDTALPAALLFTLIYILFYLTGSSQLVFHAMGEQMEFISAMLLLYGLLWALLRQIKIEASLDGKRFDEFLMLMNRNTGVVQLNNWIILGAAAAIIVSFFLFGSDFIPLFAVILIGVWVNNHYITREPWIILDSENASDMPEWEDGDAEDDALEPPSDKVMDKTFRWTLDSPFNRLNGELTVRFNLEKIAELRNTNPFHLHPAGSFKTNIMALLEQSTDNTRVHQVLRYINRAINKAGLSELEQMQFILDFVQSPNITYKVDSECEEIENPREYARFPDETMFDGRGDCDCKAVLAAVLFKEAGFKTAYITTMDHAAVAVASKRPMGSRIVELGDTSLLTNDGHMYYFCETTGDGFRIGDLGDTTKDAIQDVIFIN